MRKVLIVCHGNICRSPMGEFILKYLDKNHEYYCESRAVSSEAEGWDIYSPAKEVLDKHNIPYTKHYAKQISQKDYEEYDDILVMDELNIKHIHKIVDDYDHKIRKLCSFDIEDPWYTGNYEKVFLEIKNGLIEYMLKK